MIQGAYSGMRMTNEVNETSSALGLKIQNKIN